MTAVIPAKAGIQRFGSGYAGSGHDGHHGGSDDIAILPPPSVKQAPARDSANPAPGAIPLLRAALLSGERTVPDTGAVRLDGEPVAHLDAGARRDRGLAFVPEDRLGRGVVPLMSLRENAILTAHRLGMVRRGMLRRFRAGAYAREVIERFNVRCTGAAATARSLSGGNLQKYIVGREIALSPRVLVVSQPTWGLDVAATAAIRQALIDMSRRSTAVLVISEELDELFEICDRLLVIYEGRVSAPRERGEAGVEEIGLLMAGMGAGP